MDQIKDLVAKIRTAVGAEVLPSISSYLATIDVQAETLISSNLAVREESIDRKKLLDSKEAELAGLQTQVNTIEGLNTKITELEGFETKYNGVIEKENTAKLAKWNEIKAKIVVEKTDPAFEKMEKIKGKFNLDDEPTQEQITANINAFEIYTDAGYFETTEVQNGRQPGGEGQGSTSWMDASKPTN